MFWLGLSLGCMAILMLYHLVGGAWGMVIRRTLESGMMTLPMMFVLFIPILLHLPQLYFWARPDVLANPKTDPKLWRSRAAISTSTASVALLRYFAIWVGMAYFLNRWSTEQDTVVGQSTLRFRAMSSMDWSSTRSRFRSLSLTGSCRCRRAGSRLFTDCCSWPAKRSRPSASAWSSRPSSRSTSRCPIILTDTEVHDHGKFMLAFTMVWAYFNFSQWLIIWAGNLPEEIPWYKVRMTGGWETSAYSW